MIDLENFILNKLVFRIKHLAICVNAYVIYIYFVVKMVFGLVMTLSRCKDEFPVKSNELLISVQICANEMGMRW